MYTDTAPPTSLSTAYYWTANIVAVMWLPPFLPAIQVPRRALSFSTIIIIQIFIETMPINLQLNWNHFITKRIYIIYERGWMSVQAIHRVLYIIGFNILIISISLSISIHLLYVYCVHKTMWYHSLSLSSQDNSSGNFNRFPSVAHCAYYTISLSHLNASLIHWSAHSPFSILFLCIILMFIWWIPSRIK